MKINENGTYALNPKYKEIIRLAAMLKENNVTHTFERMYDGWQIRVYVGKKMIGDVIEHYASYGSDADMLESMGFGKDVLGCRSAEECLALVKKAVGRKDRHYA